MDAVVFADDFESTIAQVPDADHVSLADEETFKQIRKQYDSLTDYQKEFIANNSKESLDKFLAAETALNALIALRDLIADGGNTTGENENGENDATEENGTEATTPTE